MLNYNVGFESGGLIKRQLLISSQSKILDKVLDSFNAADTYTNERGVVV